MAKKRSVKAELGDLKAELSHSAGDSHADAEAKTAPRHEAETLLRDLEACLGKAGEEAEDLVVRHPLAAVAAAFLLGILAGRMVGR